MGNEFTPIVPDAEIINMIASYNDEDGFIFLNPEYSATLTCVTTTTVCVYGNKNFIDELENVINSSFICDDFNELYFSTSVIKVLNSEKFINCSLSGVDKKYFSSLNEFINESINKLKDFPELLRLIVNNLDRVYLVNNSIQDEEIFSAFRSLSLFSYIKTFFKTAFERTSDTSGKFTLLSSEENAYQDFVCILSIIFPVLFYIEQSNGNTRKDPQLNEYIYDSMGVRASYYLLYNGMNLNYKHINYETEDIVERSEISNTEVQSDPFEIINLDHRIQRKGSTNIFDHDLEYFSILEQIKLDVNQTHYFKQLMQYFNYGLPFYIFGLFDFDYYNLDNITNNNLEPLINLILMKRFADLHDCLVEAINNPIFLGLKDYFLKIKQEYAHDVSTGNLLINSQAYGVSLNMNLIHTGKTSDHYSDTIKNLYSKGKPSVFIQTTGSELRIDLKEKDSMEDDYGFDYELPFL